MLKTFETMPRGVASLYFIQAYSTFSYAILYSSLPLYITKQIGLSNALSNSIVGLFLAFNYILQLLGGLVGGRYLSNKFLFFITILIQTIGLVFLSLCDTAVLYVGLSFFLVGCGLNTTCYNNMMTQRFAAQDHRRENAFILSYGAMNIGFFAGYFASGFFDYSNQYQYLFYLCMITNAMTLVLISKSWSYLTDKNTPLMNIKEPARLLHKKLIGLSITLLLIPGMLLCFYSAHISNGFVVLLSLIMFFIVLTIGLKQKSPRIKQGITAYLILAASSIVFWMIYLTGPVGVTLFIKNNVDRTGLGIEWATQWIKNINPIAIILGAPLLTVFLNKLMMKGYKSTIVIQFISALLLLALSFVLLSCGIIYSNAQGYTNLSWVIGYVVLQGLAELLIAPIGLAMIGRIAPPEIQGILMGTWMLVTGVAASLSHYLSNAMTKIKSVNPLLTNEDFLKVFKQLSFWALATAVLLYFVAPKIKNLIEHEEDLEKEAVEIASTV